MNDIEHEVGLREEERQGQGGDAEGAFERMVEPFPAPEEAVEPELREKDAECEGEEEEAGEPEAQPRTRMRAPDKPSAAERAVPRPRTYPSVRGASTAYNPEESCLPIAPRSMRRQRFPK